MLGLKLTYTHMPPAGTIVTHEPGGRWLIVDREAMPDDEKIYYGLYTMYIREADYMGEVVDYVIGHRAPQSEVEHFIIRRKWTPYGFAKVYGETPTLRAETIPMARQIEALQDWGKHRKPRPRSANSARRKALREIRQAHRHNITVVDALWKQRIKRRDTSDSAVPRGVSEGEERDE